MDGVEWLVGLRQREINGILADEMGLGKTVQTVALLEWVRAYEGKPGPHLVIAPKSTLSNWRLEFERWTPHCNLLVLIGDKEQRADLIANRVKKGDFDVILSSYEIVIREKAALRPISFDTVAVDEAHRLKNETSLLSRVLRTFSSQHRVLLTGTPLQNNLRELWALLNFLLPERFSDGELFGTMFDDVDDAHHTEVVHKLHRLLRPFLLRRVKADVESLPPKRLATVVCPLSDIQRKLYKDILSGNSDAFRTGKAALGQGRNGPTSGRLHNILTQLWKCCNHPYLFDGIEPGPPYADGPHLWESCGKLRVLDALLPRLHAGGHRVLLFSQMTRVLDVLEDYLSLKGWRYCRIDGQTSGEDREAQIAGYNAPDSDRFVFLLSTRAGGLGINLATADTVVLYDTSWNPQQDLQAMDRAHRIGQRRPVNVYKFLSEHTVEEKINERAELKLRLDALVIEQGRLPQHQQAATKEQLLAVVTHGAEEIFRTAGRTLTDADIDALLQRAVPEEPVPDDVTDEKKEGLLKMITSGEHDTDYIYQFEGQEFARGATTRARELATIAVEAETDKLRSTRARGLVDAQVPKKIKAKPRRPDHPEWQFFGPELMALVHKEEAHWSDPTKPDLTAEEKAEKARLVANERFTHWRHNDYRQYVRCCELHGRTAHARIAEDLGRSVEDVVAYSTVFWASLDRLRDGAKVEERVTKGEQRMARAAEHSALLTEVAAGCKSPSTIVIPYPPGANRGQFTDREDRWLVYHTAALGYGAWDELQRQARRDPETCLDWYLKSRTTAELQRRVDAVLRWIGKRREEQGRRTRDAAPPSEGKRARTV